MCRGPGSGRKVTRPARQLALPCSGLRGTQPSSSRTPPPRPDAPFICYAASWPRRCSPSRHEIRRPAGPCPPRWRRRHPRAQRPGRLTICSSRLAAQAPSERRWSQHTTDGQAAGVLLTALVASPNPFQDSSAGALARARRPAQPAPPPVPARRISRRPALEPYTVPRRRLAARRPSAVRGPGGRGSPPAPHPHGGCGRGRRAADDECGPAQRAKEARDRRPRPSCRAGQRGPYVTRCRYPARRSAAPPGARPLSRADPGRLRPAAEPAADSTAGGRRPARESCRAPRVTPTGPRSPRKNAGARLSGCQCRLARWRS